MQFTIPKHTLKDALAGLGKVVPTKSALPILHHIRVNRRAASIC